ncbi:MAG: restriction endonuclease subunit S [Bacteroidota bacterium]
MTGVKKYRLSDLINVKHGFAFKGEYFSDEPTNDILLSPGNFKIGGGFKSDKFKYYNGEFPKDYILKEGDILITMTDLSKAGDTLGYSAKIPPHNGINYLHNQRLGLVQFKNDEIDPDFLYWILRTQPYQYYIVGSATGSTVKHTSPTRICSYEFEAPIDKKKQQEIAQILTSLDDKIELNLQMNQTLEAMAQALFKEWFVNFNFPNFDGELENDLPKGWRMGKVGEILQPKRGRNITKAEAIEGVFPVVAGGLEPSCYHNESNTKEPVITISSSGANAGFVRLYQMPVWSADSCFIDSSIFPFVHYIYIFLKSNQKNIYDSQEGSAQPHIYPRHIMDLNICVGNESVVKQFEEIVTPLFEKIKYNALQIQTLTHTRDTLLPKLMSGKLEIKK